MLASLTRAIAAAVVLLCFSVQADSKEEIGEAVHVETQVTGSKGPIQVKSPVYRNEKIQTSKSGLGQFIFEDGTKLAVGWGSSVTIDKFVYDDSASAKKFAIKATKGTFRWISGDAGSSAYKIVTPAGTIGVRGTAFDFYVARDGTTAVVLLNGNVQFCGAGGCRELKRRCDCVVAKRGGPVSEPQKVNRNVLAQLGNTRALPFLSGNQELARGFLNSSGCGLSAASFSAPGARSNERPAGPSPTPSPPSPPDPPSKPSTPSKPSAPDTPSKPTTPSQPDPPDVPDTPTEPNDPDKPDKPHKPDKPDRPDKPHHHEKPDKPDKPDRHGGKGHGKGHGHGRGGNNQ